MEDYGEFDDEQQPPSKKRKKMAAGGAAGDAFSFKKKAQKVGAVIEAMPGVQCLVLLVYVRQ